MSSGQLPDKVTSSADGVTPAVDEVTNGPSDGVTNRVDEVTSGCPTKLPSYVPKSEVPLHVPLQGALARTARESAKSSNTEEAKNAAICKLLPSHTDQDIAKLLKMRGVTIEDVRTERTRTAS